ncbi:hypothetical protein EVJ58_g10062 [Rhodofomes roseus]|uniref:Uncharacterized protein n=1 Tax=Rhodofomes roseus TaxID=34475 RepID=A0A4Y9XSH4_9APHY|nr:hypothetical protein EVJ58_g10062 [Rhodofomes roseus]
MDNTPFVGLAEGRGSFTNVHLAALVIGVPWSSRPSSITAARASSVTTRQSSFNSALPRGSITFSVDQPAPPTASSIGMKKPDLKPSAEFKDNALKRGHPATRSTGNHDDTPANIGDKDRPLTQRSRKPDPTATDSRNPNHDNMYSAASLRFPTLFSDNFGDAYLDRVSW